MCRGERDPRRRELANFEVIGWQTIIHAMRSSLANETESQAMDFMRVEAIGRRTYRHDDNVGQRVCHGQVYYIKTGMNIRTLLRSRQVLGPQIVLGRCG